MLEQNINKIKSLVHNLTKANILVLDKEISLFLSALATHQVFKDTITQCNHNYSFSADWQKLLLKKQFILPHNRQQKIAFIIGLLYKLDIKRISSIDMLKTFYPDYTDLQLAYNQFCIDIILPLEEAFIAILKGEPVEIEQPTAEEKTPILDKMNEDIQHWLSLILVTISQNKHNNHNEKELYFMIKGFSNILESNDINLIKLLWLGLKNTLYKYNLGLNEIDEIEKLFALYGLDMGF